MFIVTVFKSRKDRSVLNIKEFVTCKDYATALLIIKDYPGHPYSIVEVMSEEITNPESIKDDNCKEDNITYWVCCDNENWDDYHWPFDTLAEAKLSAKECLEKEHCKVYIEKHFEKVWAEV